MSRFAHEHPDDPEGAMERLIDRADFAKTEAREAGSLTDEIFATVRSATAVLYPEARIPNPNLIAPCQYCGAKDGHDEWCDRPGPGYVDEHPEARIPDNSIPPTRPSGLLGRSHGEAAKPCDGTVGRSTVGLHPVMDAVRRGDAAESKTASHSPEARIPETAMMNDALTIASIVHLARGLGQLLKVRAYGDRETIELLSALVSWLHRHDKNWNEP